MHNDSPPYAVGGARITNDSIRDSELDRARKKAQRLAEALRECQNELKKRFYGDEGHPPTHELGAITRAEAALAEWEGK